MSETRGLAASPLPPAACATSCNLVNFHRRPQTSSPAVGVCLGAAAVLPPRPAPSSCRQQSPSPSTRCSASASAVAELNLQDFPIPDAAQPERTGKVLIAGAGIGGLVLALGLLKRGFNVQLFERDVTAIRGEGKYRGPIQVQSNALAALEALDAEAAAEIMASGCVTGDRINGLCDGETGDWYVKFDTFHPAVDRGLPVTRVISRVTLQDILARACIRIAGEGVIENNAVIVDYVNDKDASTGQKRVWAVLQDGRRFEGDVLVGADGIWSKVRHQLLGPTKPSYSQYTCYTGISDFVPADVDMVGYRVFLGNGKYFVSSDVGHGKQQWYGFHKEAAGGDDLPGARKERLMDIFGHWCDDVVDLIQNTPEEDVLRRDIYDRPPVFNWTDERVVLVGDSAHAMQPNLGQGGCMAIEDAYTLAQDLSKAVDAADGNLPDFDSVIRGYTAKRLMRVSTIHGLAGMAAFMASTYKAYLGEGLGPLSGLTELKIPHPGRVTGQVFMKLFMPSVLSWVLGGNSTNVENRAPVCHLNDRPRGFDEQDFPLFMRDDDALRAATRANWLLLPQLPTTAAAPEGVLPEILLTAANVSAGAAGVRFTVGRSAECQVVADLPGVADRHLSIERDEAGVHWVSDLGSQNGTWVNGRRVGFGSPRKLLPGDLVSLGGRGAGSCLSLKVKLLHESVSLDGRPLVSPAHDSRVVLVKPPAAAHEAALVGSV